MAKIPQLPAVPVGIERGMHDFLTAVKAWINLRGGSYENSAGSAYIEKAEYDARIAEIEARLDALENP